MGFEGALVAMYEEPGTVKELLEHISKFYTMVLKKQLYYLKPEIYVLMDDDAAFRAPFFSLDMYREFFKPFHKLHAEIVLDAGCVIDRHDCGKSEQFIDDWLEIGVSAWNPAQITNDCAGIKKKYGGRLALSGCWDGQAWMGEKADEKKLRDALAEYTDTFAPGGGFTFSAMMSGPMDDPVANGNREMVKRFYYDYVRDWYKTH
jgi:uroporphyrinogen-III decarboxylase